MTADGQASRIQRLTGAGSALFRCHGTFDELERLQRHGEHDGWRISRRPAPGDLLLGLVASPAYVVDLIVVEKVVSRGDMFTAVVDSTSEVRLEPSVSLERVMRRLGTRGKNWQVLRGPDVAEFGDALVDELREAGPIDDIEGQERWAACRRRSARNRRHVLKREQGVCQSCSFNPRPLFGATADTALDVHHQEPLAGQPRPSVRTSTDALILLCATCHRLTHARHDLDWEGVRATLAAYGSLR
ncbi:MAG: hypothetical protein HY830_02795 [Actinobacteria bacterium]|nr:hypothetical protein [Actinomycetota bacterium]